MQEGADGEWVQVWGGGDGGCGFGIGLGCGWWVVVGGGWHKVGETGWRLGVGCVRKCG